MADWTGWRFILTVCVTSVLVVKADIKAYTPVGQLFVFELQREAFQNEFEPFLKHYGRVYNDPMLFKCNMQSFPDLPGWLRFTQRHHYDNGFLYGTPLAQGKSMIEITVTNKRSYDTFRDRLIITIDPPAKRMPYQAEFFIPLREIEKVLPSTVQEEIRQDMMRMWKTDRLDFVNITSALDRGGRVPLPLAGHYEGVYVKVGSDQYFSECLLRLQTAEHRRQCEAGGRAKIPGDCKVCSYPGNCVTWCKSTLIDLSRPVIPPPAPTMGPGILDAGGVYDPPESPPPRDFLPDYIVTVIVPLALAIILCLLLAYIMCCRREGVERRDGKTPDIQLYHHHTIHGNTSELRSMAGYRGVPPPLSTLSMFNARTGETAPPFQTDSPSIPLILAQQEINTDTLPRK
ncbi:alpha-sarcoglycan [Oncorhynchus kisutch]|uniref:Sarcoglycan alpha n=1 Tax=Oncorhynchus kisutch TaxID=8019 RepID=A0A8C7F6B4_ONCKI|nr:alpha-sarcoglycan [Oncorhynchus kisutch]